MGNVILVTGSTGFVGKVVVETLFRCRASFLFDKVIVLVRANKTKSARERFLDLAKSSPCFSLLTPGWTDDVRVVEGDMATDDCGITNQRDAAYLYENTTHIIHCAASISFIAAADVLLRENVGSSLNLLVLARRCRQLRHAVLTSTAYVTPWSAAPIHEQLVPLPVPAAELCERLRSGALSGDDALKLTGHPNLYTLTKCLAEHVVAESRRELPLTIVRPSIVSAAWQYPVPGWVDSYAGATGIFTGVWTGVLRVVSGELHSGLDIVPVDDVAMSLVSTCLADVPQIEKEDGSSLSYPLRIFHATAGIQHNISAAQVYRIMASNRLPAHPTMKPSLRYHGQHALLLPLADFVHQAVPLALGRNLARARRMQQSCNRYFAHFESHAYDFRSSSSLLDAGFEVDEYLERVFRGAARFLLKLDVSLQTVATEKLYSQSESECEGTVSGSGSSSSSGGDEEENDDSSDNEGPVSGGSPASSIMEAAGVTGDDAVKVGDEEGQDEETSVNGEESLPEKSQDIIIGVAVAA
ncbi:secondary metabolism biosynthetic enzyme [Apiospora marii]|uniref:Fatty acyl-CoA reductase n=1 Tax=Apiospora marii TaxID=335849 RepID=A0ABR1S9W8_9PEZI